MDKHSILFYFSQVAFLERLCDSVRPYGVVNVRPRLVAQVPQPSATTTRASDRAARDERD